MPSDPVPFAKPYRFSFEVRAESTGAHRRAMPRHRLRDDQYRGSVQDVERSLLRASLMSPVENALLRRGATADIEEYVQRDMETFWRWCPTPSDGLHRCGLLVKLFDYCGLTRKECKLSTQVLRLDQELRKHEVVATNLIQAHQRVPYEAFVQCRRLREAIMRCADVRFSFEQQCLHQRRNSKGGVNKLSDGRTPVALWVLSVINPPSSDRLEKPAVAPSNANEASPSEAQASASLPVV
mmetsp:Transcript_85639/g.239214  ORF Transcript_85639/g.239214 Transcript_85639/m.239214 type:complete len:239 (+) Transcript_85639:94-810(+)